VDPGASLDALGKRKSLAHARDRIPFLHPVARRYTDWGISAFRDVYFYQDLIYINVATV
jgi:hypothetical protein